MGLKRPMRGRGSLPLGLGAKGGAHPPHGRRTPPLVGFSPTWGGEESPPPSLAYKRRGGGAFSQHNIEFFLSLFLRPRADSPCSEFAPGWGFHHHPDAVAQPESGSGSAFFLLLFWFGARRDIGCTVRV